jgi:hypothetical protein
MADAATTGPPLGISAALRTRNRGIGSLSMVLRIAAATTVSWLIARHFSGSPLPIFAPITTLLVVQASPFSTLGMTAQQILGTGLGVAAATLYITVVPIAWWSVFLALALSLLVARMLPVSNAGQLQIPLATVFVLAIGPSSLGADLWRVADVVIGGIVGVIAVFVPPPRPTVAPLRQALDDLGAEIVALVREIAEEIVVARAPLAPHQRHAFVATSRALHPRTLAVIDHLEAAVESVRFNPRARAAGAELDVLDRRTQWMRRLVLQVRGLSGAVDRLYDRDAFAPALPGARLHDLLGMLAALLDVVDVRSGERTTGEPRAVVVDLDERFEQALRDAVREVGAERQPAESLASLSILGRLDHLRAMVVHGPSTGESYVESPEDDPDALDDDEPGSLARIRALLGFR